MSGYVFAVTLSVLAIAFLFFLLRTRRIREKYAAIWISLALVVVVLGTFPRLAFFLADLAGVETPINLLFVGGFGILLAVCIQLSANLTTLEERTRTLAEELALLKLATDDARLRREDSPPPA